MKNKLLYIGILAILAVGAYFIVSYQHQIAPTLNNTRENNSDALNPRKFYRSFTDGPCPFFSTVVTLECVTNLAESTLAEADILANKLIETLPEKNADQFVVDYYNALHTDVQSAQKARDAYFEAICGLNGILSYGGTGMGEDIESCRYYYAQLYLNLLKSLAGEGTEGVEIAKSATDGSKSTSTQNMPWYAYYDSWPDFDNYIGTPAKLDFDSNSLGHTYRTRISDAAEKGPNFSGHFTIAEWGCGTECQSFAVIDENTGKIYDGLTSEHGIEYRLDSTLVVINPLNWYDLNGLNGLPDWLTMKFYEWTGEKFSFLGEYKWNGKGMQQIR